MRRFPLKAAEGNVSKRQPGHQARFLKDKAYFWPMGQKGQGSGSGPFKACKEPQKGCFATAALAYDRGEAVRRDIKDCRCEGNDFPVLCAIGFSKVYQADCHS